MTDFIIYGKLKLPQTKILTQERKCSMKKLLSVLFVIIFFVSMLLSSCTFLPTNQQNDQQGNQQNNQQNEQPKELTSTEVMNRIAESMEKVTSFQANAELEMTAFAASDKMIIQAISQKISTLQCDQHPVK